MIDKRNQFQFHKGTIKAQQMRGVRFAPYISIP